MSAETPPTATALLLEQTEQLRTEIVELAEAVITLAERTNVTEAVAKRNRRTVMGLIISLALDFVITGVLIVNNHRYTAYVHCQAQYNEINNERTRLLADVGTREREAERAMTDALNATLLDPSLLRPSAERTPADVKRVADLFLAYRTAAQRLATERAAADASRAANPVPGPPSETCG